jgi:DNA-binding transcriptional ArsR family regulator
VPHQLSEREIPTDLSSALENRALGRFLKGPIPLSLICAAARLPGQSLALYLAVRHRSDLTRSDSVTVPAALLRSFGIDKDAKSRALKLLAAEGLVKVEQRRGRSARVTLRAYHREQR